MRPTIVYAALAFCSLLVAAVARADPATAGQAPNVPVADIPAPLLTECLRDAANTCVARYVSLDARVPGPCELGVYSCVVGSMRCELSRDKVVPLIRDALHETLIRHRLIATVNDETDAAVLLIATAPPPDIRHRSFYRIRADFTEIAAPAVGYPMGGRMTECRVFLSSKKIDIPMPDTRGVSSWTFSDDPVTAEAIDESWRRLSAATVGAARGDGLLRRFPF